MLVYDLDPLPSTYWGSFLTNFLVSGVPRGPPFAATRLIILLTICMSKFISRMFYFLLMIIEPATVAARSEA
jgi:hypothetical protein